MVSLAMTNKPMTLTALPATWFDGRSSRRHAVQLQIEAQTLVMRPLDGSLAARHFALADLRPAEAWPDSNWPLDLPDGGRLWLGATTAAMLAPKLPQQAPGLAQRLSASWAGALACLVCLLALLVWFDRQGAGLAAQGVLGLMPRSVDQKVGELVEAKFGQLGFQPSRLPMERERALKTRFVEAAAQAAPGVPVQLYFRRQAKSEAGFNAFALPNGSIVVFDGLAQGLSDDELMAVLGHELGHVVHRHGMQNVLRSFGLLSVAGVVLSDFSTVAATVAATVQGMRYSRDAEREADAYARRFIAQQELPPQTLAAVWLKFKAEQRRLGAGEIPGWLSTHPGLDERLATEQAGPR